MALDVPILKHLRVIDLSQELYLNISARSLFQDKTKTKQKKQHETFIIIFLEKAASRNIKTSCDKCVKIIPFGIQFEKHRSILV